MISNHLSREFRIVHKLFLLSVVNGGQVINFVERNRVKDYVISFELGVAAWLCDIVELALSHVERARFHKKFRGSSYILLVEIKVNKNGRFLQITRIENGIVNNLIVPEEEEGRS